MNATDFTPEMNATDFTPENGQKKRSTEALPAGKQAHDVEPDGAHGAGHDTSADQPEYDGRIDTRQRGAIQMSLVSEMGHGRPPWQSELPRFDAPPRVI
jgi:hypothetical protein